jgi:hypothetical protein
MSKVFTPETMTGAHSPVVRAIHEYFSDRKPVPIKNVSAQVDRNKWEVIKEYAKYKGCPQKRVEDALVCFAIDSAYREALQAQTEPRFKQWQENKRMMKAITPKEGK